MRKSRFEPEAFQVQCWRHNVFGQYHFPCWKVPPACICPAWVEHRRQFLGLTRAVEHPAQVQVQDDGGQPDPKFQELIDGDVDTGLVHGTDNNRYVQVDLGWAYPVESITIHALENGARHPDNSNGISVFVSANSMLVNLNKFAKNSPHSSMSEAMLLHNSLTTGTMRLKKILGTESIAA